MSLPLSVHGPDARRVAVMSELRFDAGHLARGVRARFTVAAGETLAIVGANGAGKSTVLALIGGLLRPDTGEIRLGDHLLTNCATGVFVPTHRRRTALLLQQASLFPHLTVARNVEFGIRGGDVAGVRDRWLEAVGARDLAERRPGELSGDRRSGWPSHVPWRPNPIWCCSTSHWLGWMPRARPPSGRC